MVLISTLRAIRPDKLLDVATQLTTMNQTLGEALDTMRTDVDTALGHWQGDAATAASARTLGEHLAGNHLGTAIDAQIDAYNDAATALGNARKTCLDLVDGAVGCTVTDDGHVSAPRIAPAVNASGPVLAAQAAANDRAATIQAQLRAALDNFDDLDATMAKRLNDASAAIQDLIEAPAAPVPADFIDYLNGKKQIPGDPRQFHDWWVTLTPAEKDALWDKDQYLGNRDGMPVVDRDHYNRDKLDDEFVRASAADDEVQRLARNTDFMRVPGTKDESYYEADDTNGYHEWKRQYEDALKRSKNYPDLETLRGQLHNPDGTPNTSRNLMLLDTQTGLHARAAIAAGNPDTADHVATFVPGTGSRVSSIDGDVTRIERMQTQAVHSGAPNTSVIAWYGYDAPPEIPNAAKQHWADAGAPLLDNFQNGLRASHDGAPSFNTVLSHSYGTTLVGDAASHGRTLDADAVAFIASPGTTVDHADQLSLTGVPKDQVLQHVFSTKADHDPVPEYANLQHDEVSIGETSGSFLLGPGFGTAVGGLAGGLFGRNDPLDAGNTDYFGQDPTNSNFGGRVFTSDPGSWALHNSKDGNWHPEALIGYDTDAHSDYWNNGCKSLKNMGDIIAGNYGAVQYK